MAHRQPWDRREDYTGARGATAQADAFPRRLQTRAAWAQRCGTAGQAAAGIPLGAVQVPAGKAAPTWETRMEFQAAGAIWGMNQCVAVHSATLPFK